MPTRFPLQVLDADKDQLPTWWYLKEPGTYPPPWACRIATAHALGWVDIVEEIYVIYEPERYAPALDLDGFLFMWRWDGAGVWTICSIYHEEDDGPPGLIP